MNTPAKKRLSRQEAKAQTRASLIEAAREVFSKQGFHAASLDQIAEAAGYTKGAIYAHFSNKEDLYLALLDKHLDDVKTNVEISLESGISFKEIQEELESEFFRELETFREWGILTLEFFSHAMRSETVRKRLCQRLHQALFDIEQSVLKREKARQKQLPLPAKEVAIFLLCFTNGIDIMAMVDSDPLYAKVFSQTLSLMLD